MTAKVEIVGTRVGGAPGFSEVSLFPFPAVLKANTEPITEDAITLLKGVNHVADVSNKSEVLYLVGTITYDDIFENHHETQFRYVWDVGGVNIEGKRFDFTKWERTSSGNHAT